MIIFLIFIKFTFYFFSLKLSNFLFFCRTVNSNFFFNFYQFLNNLFKISIWKIYFIRPKNIKIENKNIFSNQLMFLRLIIKLYHIIVNFFHYYLINLIINLIILCLNGLPFFISIRKRIP